MLILESFNLGAFLVLLLSSLLAAYLCYFLISKIIINKRTKWAFIVVFFIIFGLARLYTFLAPFSLTNDTLRIISSVLNIIPDIGFVVLVYVILKKIVRILKSYLV